MERARAGIYIYVEKKKIIMGVSRIVLTDYLEVGGCGGLVLGGGTYLAGASTAGPSP